MGSNKQKIERTAFHHRIRKLNENHEHKEVWYSIDRPMRPLVFELNRIGFITEFSCCGFSYDDEEEPKTHISNHAYVFFFAPEKSKENLIKFYKKFEFKGNQSRWSVWKPFSDNPVWKLAIRHCAPDLYSKSDGIPESIHDYEFYAVSIHSLAGFIQQQFPTVNDPVRIIDGNKNYEHFEEWAVRPKREFVIGVDEYYEKFGRLKSRPTFPTDQPLISDVSNTEPEEVREGCVAEKVD